MFFFLRHLKFRETIRIIICRIAHTNHVRDNVFSRRLFACLHCVFAPLVLSRSLTLLPETCTPCSSRIILTLTEHATETVHDLILCDTSVSTRNSFVAMPVYTASLHHSFSLALWCFFHETCTQYSSRIILTLTECATETVHDLTLIDTPVSTIITKRLVR